MSPAIPQRLQDIVAAHARNNPERVVEITDYLLVTSQTHDHRVPAGKDGPVDLGGGVRLERIDRDLAARLLRATELRGENWPGHPRAIDDLVQAYVRTVWREDSGAAPGLWAWDADGCIYPCVQLSRLIRDNATSTEHAARRLTHADGNDQLVPFDGFYSHVAFQLYPDRPGWLDADDARQLAALVHAYDDGSALPPRVQRALRRVDAITRERYLEDALPLVVGGLESLLKVGPDYLKQLKVRRDYARQQFTQRVPALASELDVMLTTDQCRTIYSDRSALVHGDGVDLSKPHERSTFEEGFISLQETLRRAVRRAIEDPAFATEFSDEALITKRWPTHIRSGKSTTTI